MITISTSTRREDYEILIRKRSQNNFAAYSPQLNKILQSDTFEQAFYDMETLIIRHIKLLADEPVEIFRTTLPVALEKKLTLDSDTINSNLEENTTEIKDSSYLDSTLVLDSVPIEKETSTSVSSFATLDNSLSGEDIQNDTSSTSNELEENTTPSKESQTKKYKRINLLKE